MAQDKEGCKTQDVGHRMAVCLLSGGTDKKLLQRALITPHERSTNTVEEIFGCCKMSPLSSVHDMLLFLFPSLLSLLMSACGWKVSTNHFLPSALLFSSFSLSVQTRLRVPATSSLHPPYPMQLSYNSDISANSPLKDISTMPKIQSPFPCPQESQAQQGGESGQSEASRSLGQILNRNIPYVKIILYSPGEVKNKIQDFLSSHAVRGCSMRTLCLLLQF